MHVFVICALSWLCVYYDGRRVRALSRRRAATGVIELVTTVLGLDGARSAGLTKKLVHVQSRCGIECRVITVGSDGRDD